MRSFAAKRRKGKSSVLLIIVILVGIIYCFNAFEQYKEAREKERIIDKTVSLFDSGKKKDALTCLHQGVLNFSDEQKEKVTHAVMRYVDSKASANNYKEAMDTLNDYWLDSELRSTLWQQAKYTKLAEVRAEYITYSLKRNDYRTAIHLLLERSNLITEQERQQLHEILTEYVLKETAAGNITNSLELFRKSWPEGKDTIYPALSEYAAKITEEISALSSPDYELARTKGSKLDCVDLQLKYCHDLHKLSYDIKRVYPDGVKVIDAELGEYHIKNIISNDSGRGIKFYPMIIFSREETSRPMYQTKTEYSVRLMPGEMFRHGAEFAAESFAEAESLLLADAVYIDIGKVTEITGTITRRKSDRSIVGTHSESRDLSIYSAVNNLAMYSVKNPSLGVVMIIDPHNPKSADEEWLNHQHKSLSDQDRMGTFDSTKVMENLDRVIEFSYMYRNERSS